MDVSVQESGETDGQTGRLNQTLEIIRRHCVENLLNTWTKYLPILEFVYNSSRLLVESRHSHWFIEETLIRQYLLPSQVDATTNSVEVSLRCLG